MRVKKDSRYYANHAHKLGWGEDSALLDKQRVKLLEKYIEGEKVLDVGCATGIYTNYLSKKGFKAYGIDFVSEFIVQAQKKFKKAEFKKGSVEKIPFPDKFFDDTYLFDILEHGDDLKILKEAKRVTKKKILVIVPRAVDRELEQAGIVFRHYIDKSHLREYQEEDFNILAEKVKLKLDYLVPIHNLYIDTIFFSLFSGNKVLKKIVRKLVLFLLPAKKYPTEYFAVFSIK